MRFVATLLLALASPVALAGLNNQSFFMVPTLDEVGLAALVGIMGALGGWLVGRRKKK